jgi:hypothetical protein
MAATSLGNQQEAIQISFSEEDCVAAILLSIRPAGGLQELCI